MHWYIIVSIAFLNCFKCFFTFYIADHKTKMGLVFYYFVTILGVLICLLWFFLMAIKILSTWFSYITLRLLDLNLLTWISHAHEHGLKRAQTWNSRILRFAWISRELLWIATAKNTKHKNSQMTTCTWFV